MSSSRKDILDRLKELGRQVRQGSYFVHRGPLNWAKFNFETYPRALTILVDESNPFAPQFQNMSISFEMFCRMPEEVSKDLTDDSVLDELVEDAQWILSELTRSVNGDGDNLVLKLDSKTSTALEVHDADLGVQGIIILFNLTF